MAIVKIDKNLVQEIRRKFNRVEAKEIVLHIKSLAPYPKKGKLIGNFKGTVIKEIKYKKFRFYCITNGNILRFGSEEQLTSLLIRFLRMSEKKDQKKVIKEIRAILERIGF